MKDPHRILGLSKKASVKEIKSVFRRIAQEYHPDKTGGDAKKTKVFCEARAAYTYLISGRTSEEQQDSGVRLHGWAKTYNNSLQNWASFVSRGGKFRTSGPWTVNELEKELMEFFTENGPDARFEVYSKHQKSIIDCAMYWMSKGLLEAVDSWEREQGGSIIYGLTNEGKEYVERKRLGVVSQE